MISRKPNEIQVLKNKVWTAEYEKEILKLKKSENH